MVTGGNMSESGLVYVISAGSFCKVGITTTGISARIAALQTGCPYKLEPIFALWTRDPRGLEMAAHDALARWRCQGEWFNCPADVAARAVFDHWLQRCGLGPREPEIYHSESVRLVPPGGA